MESLDLMCVCLCPCVWREARRTWCFGSSRMEGTPCQGVQDRPHSVVGAADPIFYSDNLFLRHVGNLQHEIDSHTNQQPENAPADNLPYSAGEALARRAQWACNERMPRLATESGVVKPRRDEGAKHAQI